MSESIEITNAVAQIRKRHQKLMQEAQVQAMKKEQYAVKELEDRHFRLVSNTYNALVKMMRSRCGLRGSVRIKLHEPFQECDREAIIAHFKDVAGLDIVLDSSDTRHITVNLTNEAKVYMGYRENKPVTLDFRQLLQDNAKQNQLWEEFLPGFAGRIIDVLHQLFFQDLLEE